MYKHTGARQFQVDRKRWKDIITQMWLKDPLWSLLIYLESIPSCVSITIMLFFPPKIKKKIKRHFQGCSFCKAAVASGENLLWVAGGTVGTEQPRPPSSPNCLKLRRQLVAHLAYFRHHKDAFFPAAFSLLQRPNQRNSQKLNFELNVLYICHKNIVKTPKTQL